MLFAALLLAVPADFQISSQEQEFLDTFERACVLGGMEEVARTAQRIDFSELPASALRNFRDEWHFSRAWRLNAGGESYLISFEREQATGDETSAGCVMIQHDFPMSVAYDWSHERFEREPQDLDARTRRQMLGFFIRVLHAEHPFVFEATRLQESYQCCTRSPFVALQILYPNDERLAELRQMETNF